MVAYLFASVAAKIRAVGTGWVTTRTQRYIYKSVKTALKIVLSLPFLYSLNMSSNWSIMLLHSNIGDLGVILSSPVSTIFPSSAPPLSLEGERGQL